MIRSHLSHPRLHIELEQIGLTRESNGIPLHQDEVRLLMFDADSGFAPISPRAVSTASDAKIEKSAVSESDGDGDGNGNNKSHHRDNEQDHRDDEPVARKLDKAKCQGRKWDLAAPTDLHLSESVARAIQSSVGTFEAETGGLLGGNRKNYYVEHFHFDNSAQRSGSTYSPDTATLNQFLSGNWDLRDIEVLGFIHSHPAGVFRPSQGDLIYARNILAALPNMPYLLMPIVLPENRHQEFHLHAYAVSRADDGFDGDDTGVLIAEHGVRLHKLQVRITPDNQDRQRRVDWDEDESSHEPKPLSVLLWMLCAGLVIVKCFSRPSNNIPPQGRFEHSPTATQPNVNDITDGFSSAGENVAFARVKNAYDLNLLNCSRVVSVGSGGAAAYIEDLARAGVGEQVIIDADTVSLTNIGTQQTYRHDLDRPKVEVIAERLHDINPNALVVPTQKWLDDISDEEMKRFLFAPGSELNPTSLRTEPPRQVLLCGLTDNFEAQARINRIALEFGVSSLCAQVYHEGRGAEISFTVPGITPACHRCALSSRYAAYLQNGFQNDVTSHGTPIFATTRLNALKGFITLAILHRDTTHPRWGGLIERIGDRNLVMLRLDPDIGQTLGLSVFDRVFGEATENSVLFDEAIWRPQKPDNPINGYPQCPDCGGTGNLRDAIGNFDDTLVMRL